MANVRTMMAIEEEEALERKRANRSKKQRSWAGWGEGGGWRSWTKRERTVDGERRKREQHVGGERERGEN